MNRRSLVDDGEDKKRSIEQRLAFVKWLQSQNEASIKNQIKITRQNIRRDKNAALPTSKRREYEERLRGVIQDELSRPLELNEKDVKYYEEQRRIDARAAEKSTRLITKQMKRAEADAKKMDALRQRNAAYRQTMRALSLSRPPSCANVP